MVSVIRLSKLVGTSVQNGHKKQNSRLAWILNSRLASRITEHLYTYFEEYGQICNEIDYKYKTALKIYQQDATVLCRVELCRIVKCAKLSRIELILSRIERSENFIHIIPLL